MFDDVRKDIAASELLGMAHDQITEEKARELGLIDDAICLGDVVCGAASWWSETKRVFWLAPAPPPGAPSCWRPAL